MYPKEAKREVIGLLFVDFKKAFDSLMRDLAAGILHQRAKSNAEKQMVRWIIMMIEETFIQLDDGSVFLSNKGVLQGSVLSPMIFNVYLEDALYSQPVLKALISLKRLFAYADDILIVIRNPRDLEKVMDSLNNINATHGLEVSMKKTQLLTTDSSLIEKARELGLSTCESYKYLGLELYK